MKYKCLLYELYMNKGHYDMAISGFKGIIEKTSKTTRINLEATTLLAVCYLKKRDLTTAEPLMKAVLTNDKVIKSSNKRFEFRKGVIERFDEEGVLVAFTPGFIEEGLSETTIDGKIQSIIHLPEEDIYKMIGDAAPDDSITLLLRIDNYSKKLLPSGEKKLLTPPLQATEQTEIGKKVFSSLKHAVHKSLCDPNSQVFKAWDKGLDRISSFSKIPTIVLAALKEIGAATISLAVPTITLIIRFGIEWYCTHHKPTRILELR